MTPGSQVQLLSGGPTMTIDSMRSSNPHGQGGIGTPSATTSSAPQIASCVWFAGADTATASIQKAEFAVTSLKETEPAPAPAAETADTPKAT